MAKHYFYIDGEGEERGPIDGPSVKLLIEAGQIRAHTPLRNHETENFTEAYRLTGGFSEEERRRKPFLGDSEVVFPRWSMKAFASWWSVLVVGCLVAIGILSIPAEDGSELPVVKQDEPPAVEEAAETATKTAEPETSSVQRDEVAASSKTRFTAAESEAVDRYLEEAESIGSAWKDPYGEKSEREQEHDLFSGLRELDAIIEDEREEFEREGGFD